MTTAHTTGLHIKLFILFVMILIAAIEVGVFSHKGLGIEDNGDGGRVTCFRNLVPAHEIKSAAWAHFVVTDFVVGQPECPPPLYPSMTALLMEWLTDTAGEGKLLDVHWIAWTYLAIFAFVLSIGIFASKYTWLVTISALPILSSHFIRFFLSTYSEAVGLLGIFCLIISILIFDNITLFLMVGSLSLILIGFSKPAFLHILAIAASIQFYSIITKQKMIILSSILLLLSLSISSYGLLHLFYFQNHPNTYRANQVNFIFTAALPSLGTDSSPIRSLHINPALLAQAGQGMWPLGNKWFEVPGFQREIIENGHSLRSSLVKEIVKQPQVLWNMYSTAVNASGNPELQYLSSNIQSGAKYERDEIASFIASPIDKFVEFSLLPTKLNLNSAGLLPIAIIALSVLLGFTTKQWTVHLVCICTSTSLILLSIITVFGDGYYELEKHMWLGSYLYIISHSILLFTIISVSANKLLNIRTVDKALSVQSFKVGTPLNSNSIEGTAKRRP